MEQEYKEIKIKILKGAVGNTEWWTEEDFTNHAKYVKELKASGEYLKEEEITIKFKPHPLFD